MVTFGDVHQQMSGKNSNWLSDINQCIHYKEPDLDCTLGTLKTKIIYEKYVSIRNSKNFEYCLRGLIEGGY